MRAYHEAAERVDTEQRNDYEPADKVPFPNSSRMISDRSVQFLNANETWFRSIMKADCSCDREGRVRRAQRRKHEHCPGGPWRPIRVFVRE